ncbi:Similar to Anthranilate synthase component 1; acc. no. P00899 [Pyronema omphalodes CBS 100304]|uniref:anthranilate synthase n=1 Tax=Pyronema omphalodes (strain CBS 100304) TaxID=1076935 RepID=U4L5Z4_PYROM|nr:Similar to Anthranilate synthase component 1; acc. no. P00899 [Pyronema omphalodes CBS 100304]
MKIKVQPDLPTVAETISAARAQDVKTAPNVIALVASFPAEFLNPSSAYLKLTSKSKTKNSFLFESASSRETIGRYSFLGCDPRKVLKTGTGHGEEVDPLDGLQAELAQYRPAKIPGLSLPPITGGALGYVSYDCVKYFEPRTKRDLKDILHIPESLFMICDTIVAFDHFFQAIKVITHMHVKDDQDATVEALTADYEAATEVIKEIVDILQSPDVPLPPQPPIQKGQEYVSNIGREGYESHVNRLKQHITKGNIIQAVPSQRFSRPTSLHPFNIYRHLRTVNPSPYLFYIDCEDFQLVGASPELLVKSEAGRIITHPIAGTVRRGKTTEEDDKLAQELCSSLKDRAEHVMLVDLARNDINRVCDPLTTTVDRLMTVERFSHVMHLVSQVSGVLREGMTRFDAFRSIFPAGTVSGAPKVKAMELIAELEGERRGVYAGAVGYWGYDNESMDTCIALRTMTVKDGVAYLQAGGGIVFDSDPYDEWMETMNKLAANIHCIVSAEERFGGPGEDNSKDLAVGQEPQGKAPVHMGDGS